MISEIGGDKSTEAVYPAKTVNKKLAIPHIAEEISQWETLTAVSSNNNNELKYKIGNQTEEEMSNSINIKNMESFVTGNEENNIWGTVSGKSPNPFKDPELTGYELFIDKTGDGAGVELQGEGSKELYLPHIPIETDIFWTGITLVNQSENEAEVTFTFYNDEGELIKTETKNIAAQTKLKGTIADLFPNLPGGITWCKITSTEKLNGAELFGTENGGICGFSINNEKLINGYLPMVHSDSINWTGISLTNPGNTTAEIKISLYNKTGELKDSFTLDLEGFHKVKGILKDIFPETTIEETDLIKIESTIGILAVEITGNRVNTKLKALTLVQ